jgi:hypothetical protein
LSEPFLVFLALGHFWLGVGVHLGFEPFYNDFFFLFLLLGSLGVLFFLLLLLHLSFLLLRFVLSADCLQYEPGRQFFEFF